MRFIVDAQLPPALARWLAAQGHIADHVADLGMQAVPDDEIWQFALRNEATIITKDADFARRETLERNGPGIVWVRLPNSRRKDLLVSFERVLPNVVAALERGETLVEIT